MVFCESGSRPPDHMLPADFLARAMEVCCKERPEV